MGQRYVRVLVAGGAVPWVIPLLQDDTDTLRAIYEQLDGVFLTGGVDVDPANYGESKLELCGQTDPPHTGNRSSRWAPQGAYRCEGSEQWIVVSVVTDDEWRACCRVIGRDDLAELTLAERQSRHDELDDVLSAWAGERDPQDAMEDLQSAGVPAGRVLDSSSVHDDPQLLRRRFWVYLPNPKMHRYKQANVSWRLVECNPTLSRHAPFFGEHTREVLTTLAGLTDDEVDQLYAAGVCADEPVNPAVG